MQQSHNSQTIASIILTDILTQAQRMAQFKHLLDTQLTKYCYSESIKYSHAVYEEENRTAEDRQLCGQEGEPGALVRDNFFPAAADIQDGHGQLTKREAQAKSADKKDKKIGRNNTQHSVSQVSLSKKVAKVQAPNPYYQLDLPKPEQQQTILKQLRKQVEEESTKLAQQNDTKKKQDKSKKKQGKEQRLGYDYNGQVLNLKSENRNNLISGGLDGQTLKSIQKLKQVKKNTSSTQIQYERKDKKFAKPNRTNNEVQFTDIKTLLSDAKPTKGVKLVQEGRVMEEKKKLVPVKELMKTLNGRKLTKEQYRRIKETTGNVAPYDDYSNANKTINTITTERNQPAAETLSQMRSASESKLSNSLTRRKSTITVNDPQLLQNLITAAEVQVVYKSGTKNEGQGSGREDKQASKFDSNDYYNLEYMKKGGSMQMIKKSRSTADLADVRLPKIESNRQEMPRIRQKLKDKEEIVRAIRRKFQQKLRT